MFTRFASLIAGIVLAISSTVAFAKPTVTVVTPKSTSYVYIVVSTPVSVIVTDPVGVQKVEFYVNNQLVGSKPGVPGVYDHTTCLYLLRVECKYDFSFTAQAIGFTRLEIRAYDVLGGITAFLWHVNVVQYDTIPPEITFDSPADNATVSGLVTLSSTATDNVGIVQVWYIITGANIGLEKVTVGPPYTTVWDSSAFAGQQVTIAAFARDYAGNETPAYKTLNVTVPPADVIPPVVTLSPTNGATVKDPTTVTVVASDNSGFLNTVRLFIDNVLVSSTNTSSSISFVWKKMTKGNHVIRAEALDRAGNLTTVTSTVKR